MLSNNKEKQVTTLLAGDFNLNAWEVMEKGAIQDLLDEEQLWQLSDPNKPTFRAGTTTDGIFLAPGGYMPGGVLPKAIEEEDQGTGPVDVHPVFTMRTPVLADHYALFLDIWTLDEDQRPQIAKNQIHSLTKQEWSAPSVHKASETDGGGT